MTILFGTLAGVYFLPNLYHSYKSIEELDNLSQNVDRHNDNPVVAPLGPERDKKYSNKVAPELGDHGEGRNEFGKKVGGLYCV